MIIDILKMELDRKLPHWLSPLGEFRGRDAIRKRNRERWLMQQHLRGVHDYDPDQPRDPHGRWASGFTHIAGKDKPLPSEHHGVPFAKWTPPSDWSKVEGQNPDVDNSPIKANSRQWVRSGVVIREPDGSIWMVKPANNFEGGKYTVPQGGVEKGLSPQATAIKEAFEETGLKVNIIGKVADFDRPRSASRYYLAERVGGDPREHGWETEHVALVAPHDMEKFATEGREKAIMAAAQAKQ